MNKQLLIDMDWVLAHPHVTFTTFWSSESPFSNFHYSPFTAQVGNAPHRFTCMEQYMMFQKASLFQDVATAKEILELPYRNPHDYKKLGRKVQNFDPQMWDNMKIGIVLQGCLLKFSQNAHLKEALMATKGTVLVEASPYDKIWGIKIGPNDPRRFDARQWRGENLLGFILTEVRRRLSQ